MNRVIGISAATIALVLAGQSASLHGQPSAPPAAPEPPTAANISRSNQAGIDHLVRAYGVSRDEAATRLRLQDEISELAHALARDDAEAFGGLFIDHEPVYKVTVLFSEQSGRTELRQSISPELRRFVQVRNSRRPLAETHRIIDELSGRLGTTGIRASVAFDHRNQKFMVTVGNASDRDRVAPLVDPGLAPDVITRIGQLPEDLQTGYVAGDYVYGGWISYNASGNAICTMGFVIRNHEGKNGILTAAHCGEPNPRIWVNGHYVTLPTPYHSRTTGNYDFQAHLTGSLTVYGYVAYTNNQPIPGFTSIVNSTPGYANSGYFGIEDGLYNVAHSVGLVRCKNGYRSGLSCGQITNSYTSYTSSTGAVRTGLVEVGQSSQRVIAFAGDSGGPVFTPPNASGYIRPAGSISGGTTTGTAPCDTSARSDCVMYYMPIDRINDQYPMQIRTMTGTLNP